MQTSKKRIQTASNLMIERYGAWITHMLTLTMLETKTGTHVAQTGWNAGAVTHYEQEITSTAACKSVRYFIECLNYELHGRRTRRAKNKHKCRIVAIAAIEGQNGNKRMHAHLLLGNIPDHKLDGLEETIRRVWRKAKWSMQRMELKTVYDSDGAAYYLAKEVGFINDDAVNWEISSIPRILLGSCA
jgi:hypothetical protein